MRLAQTFIFLALIGFHLAPYALAQTADEAAETELPPEQGSGTQGSDEARTSPPAREPPRPKSDDPGIDKAIHGVLAEARTGLPRPPFDGPSGAHLRLFFRRYKFHCATGACWYDGAGLMVYPTAWIDTESGWRILRFGIGIGGAGETSQSRERWWQHDFTIEAALAFGLQYPWHLTPYAEFLLSLGALHRNVYNSDDVFFSYSFGFDAGLEWFAWKSINLAASIGWRRSIVKIGRQALYADSLTFSVGLGF
ncbi:MAG: hypothetical protein RBU30_22650 [Polyangia bacterium]|nr:hypothetical protein [Polyangia bacterium]